MKPVFCFFSARRYWSDEKELQTSFAALRLALCKKGEDCRLIVDGEGLEQLTAGEKEALVIVPLSGAVQATILKAAEQFPCAVVYAGYVRDNFNKPLTDKMLACNAAPTVMDVWSVLRRSGSAVLLAVTSGDLKKCLKVLESYLFVKNAKLLLVGETEPWVISASCDTGVYEKRLGVRIQRVAQQELADLYKETTQEQSKELYERYKTGAKKITEPTDSDIAAAARMGRAIVKLLERHEADGAAIACFNLLSVGTTACMGVSYVNDSTSMVAACEGDLDSACTMLMMKKLCDTKVWMANPGLQPDRTVNFSHCTAPLDVLCENKSEYILRSHHESGIGVSTQVALPIGQTLTACRISNNASQITVQRGVSVSHEYEPCCRTQLCVQFEDYERYLATALGCHQVFAFEDKKEELERLAGLLGLSVL